MLKTQENDKRAGGAMPVRETRTRARRGRTPKRFSERKDQPQEQNQQVFFHHGGLREFAEAAWRHAGTLGHLCPSTACYTAASALSWLLFHLSRKEAIAVQGAWYARVMRECLSLPQLFLYMLRRACGPSWRLCALILLFIACSRMGA